jgi:hypothetical protein
MTQKFYLLEGRHDSLSNGAEEMNDLPSAFVSSACLGGAEETKAGTSQFKVRERGTTTPARCTTRCFEARFDGSYSDPR